MPAITLKNIPPELHRRLKERAVRNRRSLNSEMLACLESVVQPKPIDPETLLTQVHTLRGNVSGTLTKQKLQELKQTGRP